MMPQMGENSEKVTSAKPKSNFSGPAGGSALERAWPEKEYLYMTRRAFLSSRVIQRQGKFDSNMLVKIFGKWTRKMKISRDP